MTDIHRWPLHRIGLAAGAAFVVGAVVLVWCDLFPTNIEPAGIHSSPPRSKTTRSDRSDTTRSRVVASRNHPEELEGLLDRILANGLFSGDDGLVAIYRDNISSFGPETIAKMLISGVPFGDLRSYVEHHEDAEFVSGVLSALGPTSTLKLGLASELGQESPLFTPSMAEQSLQRMRGLTGRELWTIGLGMSSRIERVKDRREALAMLNQYYESVTCRDALKPLSSAAVSMMNTKEALEWFAAGEPEMMKAGELKLFNSLTDGNCTLGMEYINMLLDNGQVARANGLIQAFVNSYSTARPEEAIKWVLSLDEETRTRQMLVTSFSNLYRVNPTEARSIYSSIRDTKIKSAFEVVLKQ